MFLDLVKAFDPVPREPLWKVLHKFGVPAKVFRLIDACFACKGKCGIYSEWSDTHTLDCMISVKQGDILAPALFTLYIVAIMC